MKRIDGKQLAELGLGVAVLLGGVAWMGIGVASASAAGIAAIAVVIAIAAILYLIFPKKIEAWLEQKFGRFLNEMI